MVNALDLNGVVRVRRLAGVIVLCSRTRHFTLTLPLSTQQYKWVPGGGPWDGPASHPDDARSTGISSGLMGHYIRTQTYPYHHIFI